MAIGCAPTRIARSSAETSTEPHAASVPRRTPSDANQGQGWLSPTRNVNVRPVKAGKRVRVDAGFGDEPGGAGAIEIRQMPRVALARIDGDGEVRRDALREERPQRRIDGDDRRAILQAPEIGDDPIERRTGGGDDGRDASKAPANASTSPPCATTPRFAIVFRR